jgi:hypothetical protein
VSFTAVSRQSFKGFSLKPAQAWTVILGFVLLTALACLAGLGKILNLVFPAGAFGVALFLYFRYPILYMGFIWWLWFLTPLVRRLADYRSGFTDPSPILLAPFLATMVTFITFLRVIPKASCTGCLPYVLSFLGVIYGYLIGAIKGSPAGVTISFLEWLSPILISCHLFVNWREYPSYQKNTQRVFLWCAIIVGTYGVFQYLIAPDWDRVWLMNVSSAGSTSFGKPEPLGMRVWSTLHGPGVFGQVMMAGLLLLLSNIEPLSLPATAFGYLSFLLCAVRSAWFGWAVGLLNLITFLKPKFQMRLTLIVLIGSLCVVPLTMIEPFSKVIGSRLETFSSIQEDGSRLERQENYDHFLGYALTNVLGDGIGNNPGLLDSQVLELLINLGWFGTLFYASGFLSLLLKLTLDSKLRADAFASTARAITLGMFCQIVFGSVISGLPGIILWGFMGVGLAAQKYHHRRILISSNSSNIASSNAQGEQSCSR